MLGRAGARVAVQWFEVTGPPRLNDHGTPGFAGTFDRTTSPELDDYLEGETYVPLRVVVAERALAALEAGRAYRYRVVLSEPVSSDPTWADGAFHTAPDASKIAFVALCQQLTRWDFDFVDAETYTEHMARYGTRPWPREITPGR